MLKEPWTFPTHIENIMTDFMRLRHRPIPYLYTMNYRNHAEGVPLCCPLYYDYPARTMDRGNPNAGAVPGAGKGGDAPAAFGRRRLQRCAAAENRLALAGSLASLCENAYVVGELLEILTGAY